MWRRAASAALAAAPALASPRCTSTLDSVCPGWGADPAVCIRCMRADDKQAPIENACGSRGQLAKAEQAYCCKKGPCPEVPRPPAPPTPPPTPVPPLPPPPAAPRKPHLVLFCVDDQGWANVGFHNPDHTITPTVNGLAKEGVILDRYYVFRWCAPTRSAFMTGRLPYHVLQSTNHVDRGMTMIPAKLKQQGYATHQFGKWHLGAQADWMTPQGRGYDTSFGYLGGGEDHWTQAGLMAEWGCKGGSVDGNGTVGVDLYHTDRPAYGENGTYGDFLFAAEAVRTIERHNVSRPIFMYVALQVMHAPEQVPASYMDAFPSPAYSDDYAVANGMAMVADQALANLTGALRRRGMWAATLLVYTSDNGGPVGAAANSQGANNWPLRGGKTNVFDGGVRVAGFVTGGALPASARGRVLTGYAHGCDWYPTFATLAGADPSDDAPGIPSVDGKDLWPYLSGAAPASPRDEILISAEHESVFNKSAGATEWNGALISGDFKLILGLQSYGFWTAPNYPNATTDHAAELPVPCGQGGCLFNIRADPSEYADLAAAMPTKLAQMRTRFLALAATRYDAARYPESCAACAAYVAGHRGFIGPCGGTPR